MCKSIVKYTKQPHYGNLNILPIDVLIYLLKYFLDYPDIVNLSNISVSFHYLTNLDIIWKYMFQQTFNSLCSSFCWKCSFKSYMIKHKLKFIFLGKCEISVNDCIISNITGGWNSAILNKPLTSGSYSITFTILQSQSIMFGITTNYNNIRYSCSGYYYPGTGSLNFTSTNDSVAWYDSFATNNRIFHKNDIITMIINVNLKNVLFIKNNSIQYPSIKWIDNKPAYIIISFCDIPNAIRFESFSKISYNYIYMECPLCSQLFASKQALFYHTNIRKYKCTQQLSCETCFKSFTNRRNLNLHKCPKKIITPDNDPTK